MRSTLREDHATRIAERASGTGEKFDELAGSLFSFFRDALEGRDRRSEYLRSRQQRAPPLGTLGRPLATGATLPTRDGRPPGGSEVTSSARLGVIVERDGDGCVWCSRPFDQLVAPTREHVIARVKGGPNWLENEVAACARCNRERGHASPVQWLDEVRQRGRVPREHVIEAALLRLAARVRTNGGARRMRRHLAAELRKLGRGDAVP